MSAIKLLKGVTICLTLLLCCCVVFWQEKVSAQLDEIGPHPEYRIRNGEVRFGDRYEYFSTFKKVEGADSATFESFQGFGIDKKSVYCEQNKIEGVKPEIFKKTYQLIRGGVFRYKDTIFADCVIHKGMTAQLKAEIKKPFMPKNYIVGGITTVIIFSLFLFLRKKKTR